jgi:hypothetical protein
MPQKSNRRNERHGKFVKRANLAVCLCVAQILLEPTPSVASPKQRIDCYTPKYQGVQLRFKACSVSNDLGDHTSRLHDIVSIKWAGKFQPVSEIMAGVEVTAVGLRPGGFYMTLSDDDAIVCAGRKRLVCERGPAVGD